jgi:hypothetical protein
VADEDKPDIIRNGVARFTLLWQLVSRGGCVADETRVTSESGRLAAKLTYEPTGDADKT